MGYYQDKDKIKFKFCNKMISRGAIGSSSHKYSQANNANTGEYTSTDIVGISVNGNRKNRVSFDTQELQLAIDANVIIVTDNLYHTNRSFNSGEREVAKFLSNNNYFRISDNQERSTWVSKPSSIKEIHV